MTTQIQSWPGPDRLKPPRSPQNGGGAGPSPRREFGSVRRCALGRGADLEPVGGRIQAGLHPGLSFIRCGVGGATRRGCRGSCGHRGLCPNQPDDRGHRTGSVGGTLTSPHLGGQICQQRGHPVVAVDQLHPTGGPPHPCAFGSAVGVDPVHHASGCLSEATRVLVRHPAREHGGGLPRPSRQTNTPWIRPLSWPCIRRRFRSSSPRECSVHGVSRFGPGRFFLRAAWPPTESASATSAAASRESP